MSKSPTGKKKKEVRRKLNRKLTTIGYSPFFSHFRDAFKLKETIV
jgi:hypothetical protein